MFFMSNTDDNILPAGSTVHHVVNRARIPRSHGASMPSLLVCVKHGNRRCAGRIYGLFTYGTVGDVGVTPAPIRHSFCFKLLSSERIPGIRWPWVASDGWARPLAFVGADFCILPSAFAKSAMESEAMASHGEEGLTKVKKW